MIALDWGSSSLRAYRVNELGNITQTRASDAGIFTIKNKAFETALRGLIGDWLDASPTIEICAAGMIGSANGWAEAPYVRAPAALADLRAQCLRVPFAQSAHVLKIAPGARCGAGAQTDVMRGEETQIFGVLGDEKAGVFCLPGTHCKWAIVEGGRIVDFRTYYTGELYQWLATQSSVAKVSDFGAPFDADAFDEAAARAYAAPEDLLNHVFQLRASVVARERTSAQAASAAQGVLIGHDCASGLQYLRRKLGQIFDISNKNEQTFIRIVGSPALTAHYARVLSAHNVACVEHAGDASVKGLMQIFRQ